MAPCPLPGNEQSTAQQEVPGGSRAPADCVIALQVLAALKWHAYRPRLLVYEHTLERQPNWDFYKMNGRHGIMKTKPVKRYRQPPYPTRLEALSDPELLRRNLPPGWRSIPGMAGSIALFLAANSLAKGGEPGAPTPGGSAAIVAPIFEHGEGRGATGCMVVAPPVFLSEEEAWQVIDEEMARHGVKLSQKAVPLKGVQIPRRFQTLHILENGKGEWRVSDVDGSAKPFLADRENPQKRLALEFLSEKDYFSKAGAPSSMSTVQSYDFRGTAKRLAEDIRKQGQEKVYLGIIYDPVANPEYPKGVQLQTQQEWEKSLKQGSPEAKTASERDASAKALRLQETNESRRLLRLQVQDFLKWLEAQGAI